MTDRGQTGSLARCVGSVRAFLDDSWTRAPLLRRGSDPTTFADLLSLDDVDHLITSSFARTPELRLVKDGTPVDPTAYTRTARVGGRSVSGVGVPRRVLEELDGGATLVLQGLQRYWPPISRFCRDLELELTHPVQANAYITPPGAQGLAVHYDTHDVFVLQLAGAKSWSIHDPVMPDPLPSQPWAKHRADPGPPCLEVELRAGDCMYVPRGFLHSARAQTGLSAHLTIGVLAETWHDVLRHLLADAAAEPALRRALPAGFARDDGAEALAKGAEEAVAVLRDWLGTVDGHAVAAAATRRFWASRATPLAGQLHNLLALSSLSDDSLVRRRPGSSCYLSMDGGHRLRVLLGDRELEMPAALEPTVRRVAAMSTPTPVAGLADMLDADSRLVLCRRLVREGLLELLPEGG